MSFAGTEIVVLDVGHGNTALLRSGEWVALVDVAPSAVVVDELESLSISRVDDVFISHVERDHAGGVEKLLNAPWLAVGHVWVNPDSETDSVTWERLRTALWHLHQREGVSVTTALNRGTNDFHHGEMRVEVLHPDVGWALGSVGGERTVNAMSVVIKVWMQGVAAALLAADVTKSGLDRLLSAGLDLAAKVLVFPHHGGRAATADGESFARMLSASVSPELVIFSLGRLKESNPRPEMVAGVRAVAPEAHIACSQLSKHCAADDREWPGDHLSGRAAAGLKEGMCCAGTITITVANGVLTLDPPIEEHRRFVDLIETEVAPPLCRRTLEEVAAPHTGGPATNGAGGATGR